MAKKKARKKRVPSNRGRFDGMKVSFTGKLSIQKSDAAKWVRSEGGTTQDRVTSDLDYLVVGNVRGGATSAAEKRAAQLNQKGSAIAILDEKDFREMFVPTPDEALLMLNAAAKGRQWKEIWKQAGRNFTVDLSGARLKGAKLSGFTLYNVNLDGADLRDAALREAQLPGMTSARLDGANLTRGSLGDEYQDCSLRKIVIRDGRLNPVILRNCDLSGANLRETTSSYTRAEGSLFRNADLSDADFSQSHFKGSDFTGAKLNQTNLEKCDFTAALLVRARLQQAKLSGTRLVRADLSRADFTNANLADADLSNAVIDGANFTGANITGAKTTGLDASKARGLDLGKAKAGKAGPKIRELGRVAKQSKSLTINARVKLNDAGKALLTVQHRVSSYYSGASAYQTHHPKPNHSIGTPGPGTSMSTCMVGLANRWRNGQLELDQITVKAQKCPLKGKALKELVVAAWCEAFDQEVMSEDEFDTKDKKHRDRVRKLTAACLAEFQNNKVTRWNRLSDDDRKTVKGFRDADLAGKKLTGAKFGSTDFQRADFTGANLSKTRFGGADLKRVKFCSANMRDVWLCGAKLLDADFTEADLSNATIRVVKLQRVSFRGARLKGADFSSTSLTGADFTGSDLEKAVFFRTKYDDSTKLPDGFVHQEGMEWKGAGAPPGLGEPEQVSDDEVFDFDTYLANVRKIVDSSRLSKALKMLKADRFQLFVETAEDHVTGVVKSQTDKSLLYSCCVGSDGSYSCCTQNLRPCGGLRQRPCKHILVLAIGLAKQGTDGTDVLQQWARAARYTTPNLDKDVMSDTFLQYKGAEAGEFDWRPVETIPEDYYAM